MLPPSLRTRRRCTLGAGRRSDDGELRLPQAPDRVRGASHPLQQLTDLLGDALDFLVGRLAGVASLLPRARTPRTPGDPAAGTRPPRSRGPAGPAPACCTGRCLGPADSPPAARPPRACTAGRWRASEGGPHRPPADPGTPRPLPGTLRGVGCVRMGPEVVMMMGVVALNRGSLRSWRQTSNPCTSGIWASRMMRSGCAVRTRSRACWPV